MKYPDLGLGGPHYENSIEGICELLYLIGEDPRREGLQKTPMRFVKAFREMTEGYRQSPEEILSTTFEGENYDQMIVLRNIEFKSLCEHHLLPFLGQATVGYIPRERIVGLSKLARLVDCFAHRLQVQERLTNQIAQAIQEVLNPLGVGVVVQAHHQCMSCRGIKKNGSVMVTSALLGEMREAEVRAEFLGFRE